MWVTGLDVKDNDLIQFIYAFTGIGALSACLEAYGCIVMIASWMLHSVGKKMARTAKKEIK